MSVVRRGLGHSHDGRGRRLLARRDPRHAPGVRRLARLGPAPLAGPGHRQPPARLGLSPTQRRLVPRGGEQGLCTQRPAGRDRPSSSVFLLFRRQRRLAAWAATTMVAAGVLGYVLKVVVERARPQLPDPVASAPGFSFPSGHALNSFAFFAMLVLLLEPLLSRRGRWIAWAVCAGRRAARRLRARRARRPLRERRRRRAGWSPLGSSRSPRSRSRPGVGTAARPSSTCSLRASTPRARTRLPRCRGDPRARTRRRPARAGRGPAARGRPGDRAVVPPRGRAAQPGDRPAALHDGQRRRAARRRPLLLSVGSTRSSSATVAGDQIYFADFRGDMDEQLDGPGTGVGQVLIEAARRGVAVFGLLWRSHPSWLHQSEEANAELAREISDNGGHVLLDARTRRAGSHHQKLVVIRHPEARETRRRVRRWHRPRLQPRRRLAAPGRRRRSCRSPTSTVHDPPGTTSRPRSVDPAVHDLEHTFRERWYGSSVLDVPSPLRMLYDRAYHAGAMTGRPLPEPLPDDETRRGEQGRPGAAHVPGAAAALSVRTARRAQHRARLPPGLHAGPAAGLSRGPVPLVRRRRRGRRGGAAPTTPSCASS